MSMVLESQSIPSVLPRPSVADSVRTVLACSAYYELRKVTCELQGHTLTLRGEVCCFFLKQVAQTIVREVLPRQIRIDNRLQVNYQPENGSGKRRRAASPLASPSREPIEEAKDLIPA